MKVEDGHWSVELRHRVSGSPEEVFEYFVDPEKYKRWQGIEVDIDPRPGGRFNVSTAPGLWARGSYVAVDPPRRIVLTWGFEGTDVVLPTGLEQVPPGSSTVEMTFEPDGDGTVITVRHSDLPTEEARWAHEQGWLAYLPRLGRATEGLDPGPEPIATLADVLFRRSDEAIRGDN